MARASSGERSQVLRGRCLPYGDGVTFWPILEIVRSAAGINDEDPLEEALDKIARVARSVAGDTDDPLAVADRVAAAIGLSTAQFPGPELFWGIRKLLEAIASHRPLVAIVDDIHVAAPTFLELIDHLLEAVRGAPILILASARHELLDARAEWAETHEASQIMLEPLSAGRGRFDRRPPARRARRVRAHSASWPRPRAIRCTSSRSPPCSSRPARSAGMATAGWR